MYKPLYVSVFIGYWVRHGLPLFPPRLRKRPARPLHLLFTIELPPVAVNPQCFCREHPRHNEYSTYAIQTK
jgi:hypothetical protein